MWAATLLVMRRYCTASPRSVASLRAAAALLTSSSSSGAKMATHCGSSTSFSSNADFLSSALPSLSPPPPSLLTSASRARLTFAPPLAPPSISPLRLEDLGVSIFTTAQGRPST
eukprot:scaffold88632_cov30-Tisochrysis_lutea.AAC.6